MSFLPLLLVICNYSTRVVPDTTVHVTYTTRAARASVVIGDLSKLTKIKLETTPQTGNEVLIISVNDVPLAEVMGRVAAVTSGLWKQDGSVYRLIADPKQRAIEEKADFEERVGRVARGIKTLESNYKKKVGAFNETVLKAKAAFDKSTTHKGATNGVVAAVPSGAAGTPTKAPPSPALVSARLNLTLSNDELILGLVKGISPASLAEIRQRERRVFSTSPTRVQRALGPESVDVINRFVQRHNELISTLPTVPLPSMAGLSPEDAATVIRARRMRTSRLEDAYKALLVMTTRSAGDENGFGALVHLYDSKGNLIFSITGTVPAPASDGDSPEDGPGQDESDKPGDAKKKETPIEYSPDSKALLTAMPGRSGNPNRLKVSPELRRMLFQPVQYDPLSYAETDEILGFAKFVNKPVIANIPDSYGGLGDQEECSVEDIGQQLKDGDVISLLPDDSFVLIKPSEPVRSRNVRADRTALGNLMRAAQEKLIPSLDDFAEFAVESPDPSLGGFVDNYFNILIPGCSTGVAYDMDDWDVLRFFGHCSTELRSQLLSGTKIAIGSLASTQREDVERIIYGSNADIELEGTVHADKAFYAGMLRSATGSNGFDFRSEVTEVAPNGPPADGVVEFQLHHLPFASPIAEETDPYLATWDVLRAEDIASLQLLRQDKEESADNPDTPPPFAKLRIGDQCEVTISFHLTPQVVTRAELRDHRISSNSAIFSEKNLPLEFQRQIAASLDNMLKDGTMSIPGNGQVIKP